MMKHVLIASAVSLPLLALGQASMAAAVYQVNGTVPQICSVELPRLLTDTAPINVTSLTGQTIGITALADPSTLATNAASFDVGFAAVCNYAHRLVIESQNNGLWQDTYTTPASGFADAVPYQAQVSWGGTNTAFRADAVTRQISDVSVPVNRPSAGDIELRFQVLAGASNAQAFAPLLAGSYSDIIRVTVEPQ